MTLHSETEKGKPLVRGHEFCFQINAINCISSKTTIGTNYSSTTYVDYTLKTVQLQRQLTFQITFALYGLNDALSYSRT